MTVQNSTAVRNAYGDAWEATIGTAPKVRLYTGAPPANCATAASGTLLVEYTLDSDWAPAASGGVKQLGNLPLSATAGAAGTAGYYRIYDSAGTTCHEQGTVTATGGGGDATINNPVIASGQQIDLPTWTKTYPGA